MCKTKRFIIGIWIIIALALVLNSCSSIKTEDSISEYESSIILERLKNDSILRYSKDSPIPTDKLENFKGLKWFSINEEFRVVSYLKRADNQPDFEMKTTTARLPVYRKYGDLFFRFDTISFSLEIYQNVDLILREGYEDYLFLPFTDETSGDESYGGGRYIDLRTTEGDSMIVDFNRAYNPYCNYNDKYSCPVPPPGNHIPFRVMAGEQDFH